MNKIRLYFDMDGVLAKYERNAYTGDNPAFKQKRRHYFRNVGRDERMITLMESALQDDAFDVFVISALSNEGSVYLEQFDDKRQWLQVNMPSFELDKFIPVITNKRRIAELIKQGQLDSTDVLIDDYNKNLVDWQKYGGLAVKYANGINSVDSYDGPIIDTDMETDDILRMLRVMADATLRFNREESTDS